MKAVIATLILLCLSLDACAAESWQSLIANIRNKTFLPVERTDEPIEQWIRCDDGVDRPYLYVIPAAYDPSRPVPMLVYLHGLTHRKTLIEDRVGYVKQNPLAELAQETGWVIVFPFSQFESNWFEDIGINKINDVVAAMKHRINIDDDRVWLGGFSDGASASMGMSMLKADNFAAFMSLSGQMGVTGQDGGKHLYPSNMASSAQYVVNTDLDRLYPAHQMRKTVELAKRAGANIEYKEHAGIKHAFKYAGAETPNFKRFLSSSSRQSMAEQIVWKSASAQYGKRFWVSVDKVIDTEAESWHVEHNMILTDEHVTVGFVPDWDYQDDGTFVASLNDGDSYANRAGLRAGDVITRANNTAIGSLDDLLALLVSIKPASDLSLTVQRDGKPVELSDTLDPVKRYPLFPRHKPSGMIDASYRDNTFFIKTSRVGAFSIWINPDMVNISSPVKVVWNGDIVHAAKIEPELSLIEQAYLLTGERKNLYIARLSFTR